MIQQEIQREITTAEFDEVVKVYHEARLSYEEKKARASEALNTLELVEEKLMAMMEASNKDKYHVKGIGTIQKKTRLSVKIPSDPRAKDELFKWIESKYGQDGLDKYRTINYNSLNSLYNLELEACIAEGKEFTGIEGVDSPTADFYLAFSKER